MPNHTCKVENCARAAKARGWCGTHYARWSKHGDPNHVTDRSRPECSVDGCDEPHNAKGYCIVHYMRVKSTGSTDLIGIRSMPADEVFENYLGEPTEAGCIEWQSTRGAKGYGRIYRSGKFHSAHRLSYERTHGTIPDGLIVRHKCDNPPCVNPDHLEIGTHLDNSNDCTERQRRRLGEDTDHAKLSNTDALNIYALKGRETQKSIAFRYGVSREAVSRILTGRAWSWLTGAMRPEG